MNTATVIFLRKGKHILLAKKKRGFGVGKWNGPGGKIEPGESLLDTVTRECQEEIAVTPISPCKIAQLHFYFPEGQTDWLVHVFECRDWEGKPAESEEMAPRWYHLDKIPYADMWEDDEHWLPHVLQGKNLIGHFDFDEDEKLLPETVRLEFVDSFEG